MRVHDCLLQHAHSCPALSVAPILVDEKGCIITGVVALCFAANALFMWSGLHVGQFMSFEARHGPSGALAVQALFVLVGLGTLFVWRSCCMRRTAKQQLREPPARPQPLQKLGCWQDKPRVQEVQGCVHRQRPGARGQKAPAAAATTATTADVETRCCVNAAGARLRVGEGADENAGEGASWEDPRFLAHTGALPPPPTHLLRRRPPPQLRVAAHDGANRCAQRRSRRSSMS